MNAWCGRCGHERLLHRRGVCDHETSCATRRFPCTCDGFVSLRRMLAQAAVVIVLAVGVLGSLVGLLGGGPS